MRMFPIPDPCKTEQPITPKGVKTENTAKSSPILWACLMIVGLLFQVTSTFSQTYQPGTAVDTLNSDLSSKCLNCTAEDIKAVDFWLEGYGPDDQPGGDQCLDSGEAINYNNHLIVKLNVTASERYGLLLVANLHVDSLEVSGNPTYYRTLIYGSNKTYRKGIAYDTLNLPAGIRPLLKAGWKVSIKNVFVAWDNNDFINGKGNNKYGPYTGLIKQANTGNPETDYFWDCKTVAGNSMVPHCKIQSEVWIIKTPTKPLIREVVTNNVTCPGGSNGSIVLSVGPWFQDYSFKWLSGETTSSLYNLASGTYTVTVTAGNENFNCKTTQDIEVRTLPAIAFTKDSVNIACKGAATGKAKVTITGGTAPFTFSWNPSSVNHTVIPGILYPRDSAYNLAAGTYRDTITDGNGCQVVARFDLREPASALKINNFTIHTVAECGKGAIGKASVNVSGGWRKSASPYYTYVWSAKSDFTGDTLSRTDTLRNVLGGKYYVKVTDSLGCSVNKDTTVPETACPPLTQGVFCTKSQGFFGNDAGYTYFDNDLSEVEDCQVKKNTRTTIQSALDWWNDKNLTFKLGNINITDLGVDGVDAILSYLPGGGPSSRYGGTTFPVNTITTSNADKAIPGNTLMAQTLTLGLNIGINRDLASFKFDSTLVTQASSGACEDATAYGDQHTYCTADFKDSTVLDIFYAASDAISNENVSDEERKRLASIAGFINEAFHDCAFAEAKHDYCSGGIGYDDEYCSKAANSLTNQESTQLFRLNAYPNPFHTSVNIGFKAPVSGTATLEILDASGRRIDLIQKGNLSKGQETVVEYRATKTTPAQLFYRITMGNNQVIGKLLNAK